jgi:hypothetical protein
MRLLKRFCVLILGLAMALAMSSVVRADAVTDWNAIAIQIIARATTHPGATSFLDSAMVQAAVYDAVEAITGRFRPYHVHIPGASGSTAAAVAKATRDVLMNRFPPSQFPSLTGSLDTTYNDYLTSQGISTSDPGIAVGAAAAAAIIALRASDHSFPNCSATPQPPNCDFAGSDAIGQWRPTPSDIVLPGASGPAPPPFAHMLAPWLATVTPFTLTSPSQFRAPEPPSLISKRYTSAFDEVKRMGARTNSDRTAGQTDLALFWYSNYLVLWERALRDIATTNHLCIDDSARLFALVNLAMGDAVITAWDTKLHYHFWRPYTAIHEADNDGNPETISDPNWLPLVNIPNYPDYTSGANNVTGAITRMLALFFGTDKMTFTVATNYALANPQMPTITYQRFSDAAHDVVNARIWEGIHFRFADVQARKQGRHVAQWVFSHFLRSVDADDHDDHEDEGDDE